MHLYDFPQSPNCRRVRMYLAEKGIDIALKSLDLSAGEQRISGFLLKNPFGAVPLLELDDGSVIPESLAIIEYLEELHPDPPLCGTTPFERAQVRAWERRAEFGVLLQGTRRFCIPTRFLPRGSNKVQKLRRKPVRCSPTGSPSSILI